jgi:hypothetical protein
MARGSRGAITAATLTPPAGLETTISLSSDTAASVELSAIGTLWRALRGQADSDSNLESNTLVKTF